MSSIMRARNGLTGRSEVSEVIGALSRAEGCWTFDARDRMPRQSRATAHHLGENAPTATRTPSRERVRSSAPLSHRSWRPRTRPHAPKRPLRECGGAGGAGGDGRARAFSERYHSIEILVDAPN